MSAWEYIPRTLDSGYLYGPMEFSLLVKKDTIEIIGDASFQVHCNHGHEAFVVFRKVDNDYGSNNVSIVVGNDVNLKMVLPYGPSFERAIEDMCNHLGSVV